MMVLRKLILMMDDAWLLSRRGEFVEFLTKLAMDEMVCLIVSCLEVTTDCLNVF